ncbi:MAG: cation-transporting P-type ATPase [Candidatus Pacearchaeota archaeon]
MQKGGMQKRGAVKTIQARQTEQAEPAEVQWHAISLEEAFKKLNSSKEGLTKDEAKRRLAIYGPNEIREVHKIKPLTIFISQFNSFFVYLLLIAALIAAIVEHWLDFFAIMAIIILNASLGFVQNYRAEKAIENLKKVLVLKAKVLRGGVLYEIDANEVVPGDIIILSEGDKVVADARLIESHELQTNEAILTGESVPVDKISKSIRADAPISERKNIVYSGTSIVRGSGKALVFNTGMRTEFGKIAFLVQEVKKEKTPLQAKLDSFAKAIGIIVIALSFIIFALGIVFGVDKLQMAFTSISLAVAAIPEGLPAVITICLAIAVRRMYKVKSLIRKLPAAETLGRVTVICTDKTGTITEEKMHVVKFFYNGRVVSKEHLELDIKNVKSKKSEKSKTAEMLIKTGILCNNARVEKINNEEFFFGDPTEQALLRAASQFGFDKQVLTASEPKVKEFPFTSARKLMSVIRQKEKGKKQELISYVKGAPEVIIERSRYEMIDGKLIRLNALRKNYLMQVYAQLANDGLRVLGFAFKKLKKSPKISQNDAESGLVFLGFQAMLDVPRPEVKNAIKKCQEAGIAIKMITGDSLLTAQAVAREIGLRGEAITADQLEKLSDEELKEKLNSYTIFARVTPEHKLRIVNLLKEQHEIVAVTGDGVNDAPALKKADIGIAMGIRGSDVARDVADIVLVDDNFASIVKAVEEGRRVFDNIKKFSYYLLSSNLAEIFIILSGLLLASRLGWPSILALLPLQILWINLVTDGIIALALSAEHGETDIMTRKPSGKLFTFPIVLIWFLLVLIIVAGIIAITSSINIKAPVKLQTVIFTALVFFEGFNALNFRSFKEPIFKLRQNWWLVLAIAISFALQIVIVELPFLQQFFGTTHLALTELLIIFLVSCSILVLGEIFKVARNKLQEKSLKN